ncbi:MAG TPA: hypothetical protein VJP89_23170 [Pyrinomonadaceae bacterium]|nr:hypothetical protein [Pyrinomonadaceae bacterium]
MRRLRQAVSSVAVVLTLLCATASAQDATNLTELPRFQQVSEKLYRSGQPRDSGFTRLRELGINTIINLRGASKQTRAEEAKRARSDSITTTLRFPIGDARKTPV